MLSKLQEFFFKTQFNAVPLSPLSFFSPMCWYESLLHFYKQSFFSFLYSRVLRLSLVVHKLSLHNSIIHYDDCNY